MSHPRELEVYIDTNGWSDLFRGQSPSQEAQLRRDLRTAARERRVRFITSGWTIDELGGIAKHNWRKYRHVVDFTLTLIDDALIVDTRELVERELRLRRPLRGRERFFSSTDLGKWHHATTRRELVREASAEFRGRADASAKDNQARRESARAALWDAILGDPGATAKDPMAAALEWFANPGERIDDWTRNELANRMRVAGLDPAAALTYPLKWVPSLWNFVAEMLARIVWNLAKEGDIRPSDDADTHHYAAARYADVLVSGDRDFTEIVRLIPGSVPPLSMLEFARTHLGWAGLLGGRNVSTRKVRLEGDHMD